MVEFFNIITKTILAILKDWIQKEHAQDWLLYAENIGT
jgi:hypothetical protein